MEKICTKCKQSKDVSNFNNSNKTKDGLNTWCKECKKEYDTQYRENNKEKKKATSKLYREKQGDILKNKKKAYYNANKEKVAKTVKKYRENNKEKIKARINKVEKSAYNKEYRKKLPEGYKKESDKKSYAKHKEKRKISTKLYREKNADVVKKRGLLYREKTKKQKSDYDKKYRQKNKEKIYNNNKQKYETNPVFKLRCIVANLIRQTIKNKGFTKNKKTQEIIGCTFLEFKIHIESLMKPWMTWDNYGSPKDNVILQDKTWDIDHIIPMKTAKTEDEVLKLNHYTNLQPMCSFENRFVKGCKDDYLDMNEINKKIKSKKQLAKLAELPLQTKAFLLEYSTGKYGQVEQYGKITKKTVKDFMLISTKEDMTEVLRYVKFSEEMQNDKQGASDLEDWINHVLTRDKQDNF